MGSGLDPAGLGSAAASKFPTCMSSGCLVTAAAWVRARWWLSRLRTQAIAGPKAHSSGRVARSAASSEGRSCLRVQARFQSLTS